MNGPCSFEEGLLSPCFLAFPISIGQKSHCLLIFHISFVFLLLLHLSLLISFQHPLISFQSPKICLLMVLVVLVLLVLLIDFSFNFVVGQVLEKSIPALQA